MLTASEAAVEVVAAVVVVQVHVQWSRLHIIIVHARGRGRGGGGGGGGDEGKVRKQEEVLRLADEVRKVLCSAGCDAVE